MLKKYAEHQSFIWQSQHPIDYRISVIAANCNSMAEKAQTIWQIPIKQRSVTTNIRRFDEIKVEYVVCGQYSINTDTSAILARHCLHNKDNTHCHLAIETDKVFRHCLYNKGCDHCHLLHSFGVTSYVVVNLNKIYSLRKMETRITWSQIILLAVFAACLAISVFTLGIEKDSNGYLILTVVGSVLGWIFQDTIKSVAAFFILEPMDYCK